MWLKITMSIEFNNQNNFFFLPSTLARTHTHARTDQILTLCLFEFCKHDAHYHILQILKSIKSITFQFFSVIEWFHLKFSFKRGYFWLKWELLEINCKKNANFIINIIKEPRKKNLVRNCIQWMPLRIVLFFKYRLTWIFFFLLE